MQYDRQHLCCTGVAFLPNCQEMTIFMMLKKGIKISSNKVQSAKIYVFLTTFPQKKLHISKKSTIFASKLLESGKIKINAL